MNSARRCPGKKNRLRNGELLPPWPSAWGAPNGRTGLPRRIRLKTLGPNSKVEKLANQIVSKCSHIISEDRIDEVMHAISDLRMAVMSQQEAAAAPSREVPAASEGKSAPREVQRRPQPAQVPASSHKAAQPGTSAAAGAGSQAPMPVAGGGQSGARRPLRRPRTDAADADTPSTKAIQPSESKDAEPIDADAARQRRKEEAKYSDKWQAEAAKAGAARLEAESEAHPDRVEDYLEGIYEVDPALRLQALRLLLALVRDPATIEAVVGNPTVLGALSRTLREDFKKNTDVTTVLMQIFYAMSHFSQLHATLTEHGVVDMTLQVVELEHKRHAARSADLRRLAALAAAQQAGDAAAEAAIRQEDADLRAAADQLVRLKRAKNKAARKARASQGKEADDEDREGHEDDSADEQQAASATGMEGRQLQRARDMAAAALKMKPLPDGKVDILRERVRSRLLGKRQEKLLFPALYLLLNLAEDVHVEKALHKRGIVGLLVPMLEHPYPDLIMLVTVFLRKLSLVAQNIADMSDLGALPRLVSLLPRPPQQEALANALTRLLYNMAFEPALAADMVSRGLVERLAPALSTPALRRFTLRLMAKLSEVPAARDALAKCGAAETILKMVLKMPSPTLPPELLALITNVSAAPAGAKVVARRRGALGALLQRALSSGDWPLLKVLVNVAVWTYDTQARAADEVEAGAHARALRRMRVARAQTEADLLGIDLRRAAARKQVSLTSDEDADSVHGVDGEAEATDDDLLRLEASVVQDIVGRGKWQLADTAEEDDAPLLGTFEYSMQGLWAPLVPKLLSLLMSPPDEAVVPEVLRLLAHLTPLDLPDGWSVVTLLTEHGMLRVLEEASNPGYAQGDVVLAAVMVMQVAALDERGASVLASSRCLPHLSGLLQDSASDVELVAQIADVLRRLAYFPSVFQAVVGPGCAGDLLPRLAEFALHANERVAAAVDGALATSIDALRNSVKGDPDAPQIHLADALQSRRFMLHNKEWCAAAATDVPRGVAPPPQEWMALASGGYNPGLAESGMSDLSASDAWRDGGLAVAGAGSDLEASPGRLGFRLSEAVGLDVTELGGGGGTVAPSRWEEDDADGALSDGDWESGVQGYWDDLSMMHSAHMGAAGALAGTGQDWPVDDGAEADPSRTPSMLHK